jgi:hypothetical protein
MAPPSRSDKTLSVSLPAFEPATRRRTLLTAADEGSRFCGAELFGGTFAGDIGLEGPGVGCVLDKCFDLCFFFRVEASVPEASERFGEPGRLRDRLDDDFFIPPTVSRSLRPPATDIFSLRLLGVLVPDEDMPAAALAASSSRLMLARRSRSRRSRSSSESV